MKPKVLLLEHIHPAAEELFRQNGFSEVKTLSKALQDEELIVALKEVDLLGIRSGTTLSKEVLEASSHLLAVGCYCIGTDQVDLGQALKQGIPVFNDPHSSTRSVAELVLGLSIALLRDICNKNAAAHAGIWKKSVDGAHEIRGKVLGIVGYGNIGSQVSILAEALGMQVFYYDIETKQALGNAKSLNTLAELLQKADIVTLHVPETPLTYHLIGHETLKHFKKSAFLINTSRGSVVDAEALADGLKTGVLQGAAIDVFASEPPSKSHQFKNPLQALENAILTPHIGGATEEGQEKIALAVTRKLIQFIDYGSTLGNVTLPLLSLPPHGGAHRILHLHRNVPGMLSQINALFANENVNIVGQYLNTNPEVGYVVLDVAEPTPPLEALRAIKGTIKVIDATTNKVLLGNWR